MEDRSGMRLLGFVGLIASGALLLQAEDFSLKQFALGTVITLHTTLTSDGKEARLIATAKNESGAPILHAKICILSAAMQTGCLFELWNTKSWAPGTEMTWNVTTSVKISNLAHNASLSEFDGGNVSQQSAPTSKAPVPPPGPIQNRPTTDQSSPETLTNDTVIKLTKAGLGDGVIIGMIGTQPGSYSRGSADIIKMKEAGVSDKVIATILNTKAEPSGNPLPRQLHIEDNSKLYIESMASNLNEFIAAEIVKQKLPVQLVLEEKDADYILTGFSQRTEVKWYDVVSGSIVGGKDRLEASAKLVRVKDKTFIWAGESGDRSLIFGGLKRGGQRKLAERIVGKMRQDLF
jgi:hypothetical protein